MRGTRVSDGGSFRRKRPWYPRRHEHTTTISARPADDARQHMRANGVRWLDVWCWQGHHNRLISKAYTHKHPLKPILVAKGICLDVEVTDDTGERRPIVSQAFCSALPVAYNTSVPAPHGRQHRASREHSSSMAL
jgi:hypothetical protein